MYFHNVLKDLVAEVRILCRPDDDKMKSVWRTGDSVSWRVMSFKAAFQDCLDPPSEKLKAVRMLESLFKAKLLSFVEQVSLCRAQIDNLWATISVLFELGALSAVVSVRYPRAATNHTTSLEGTVITLIANTDKSRRSNVGITNDTSAVALVTESSNRHPSLLPTKNQIWVMFCHH